MILCVAWSYLWLWSKTWDTSQTGLERQCLTRKTWAVSFSRSVTPFLPRTIFLDSTCVLMYDTCFSLSESPCRVLPWMLLQCTDTTLHRQYTAFLKSVKWWTLKGTWTWGCQIRDCGPACGLTNPSLFGNVLTLPWYS